MKKKLRLISVITCLLYISVIFPSIFVYAATDSKAYNDGYISGFFDGTDAAYDDIDAAKKNPSYSKVIPKDAAITSYYDLDKETSAYKREFIRGYKVGFKEGYNATIENPRIDVADTDYEESIGYEMGKACGFSDYYAGKNNRWAGAIPSTAKLRELFNLDKETNSFKNNFIIEFKKHFQEGYEYAFRYANFEPKLLDIERGEKDGETIGGLLGTNYGTKDYYDGNSIDWERDMLSDNEIEITFSLRNDVADYRKSFMSAFKKAYREKYDEAYRNANLQYQDLLFMNGYESGNRLGMNKGVASAKSDFTMGKPNDSKKYNFSDENLSNEYNLHNESKRFRDGFIGGFKAGFNEGYIESYQQVSFAAYSEKIGEETVPIGGGHIMSNDGKMIIAVENGTFYNEVVLTMDKHMQARNAIGLPNTEVFTKNSDLYLLKINNPYIKYDNDKMIKLSLEYYGGMNGGIYRYLYGNWQYLPSTITENTITAYLSPKTIQENAVYGVFIDTKAITPLDIRGHWAKDEVITTLRRGHTGLYKDDSFRPDVSLTKVQLLLYLGRANKWWKLNLKDEDRKLAESLKDFKDIEDVKELVAYSIKEGFLGVSKDNKFNPNSTISYGELEKIIKKVYPDSNFTWKWVSDKMATIKDKRCSSVDSMNNKVTRAEFAYMLNLLNQ